MYSSGIPFFLFFWGMFFYEWLRDIYETDKLEKKYNPKNHLVNLGKLRFLFCYFNRKSKQISKSTLLFSLFLYAYSLLTVTFFVISSLFFSRKIMIVSLCFLFSISILKIIHYAFTKVKFRDEIDLEKKIHDGVVAEKRRIYFEEKKEKKENRRNKEK
jgi:magnesium-transporting ATPase (P-type)